MRFVITGLPRTRTAWFAAYFMGVKDTICYHEASFMGNEMDVPYRNIGNSEAGVPQEWLDEFKPQKIVVVHRPVAEVERSLEIIGQPVKKGFIEALEERNQGIDGLHVDFYDINIEKIHDYLGLAGHDPYRAALFADMNVQSKHWR